MFQTQITTLDTTMFNACLQNMSSHLVLYSLLDIH